MKKILMERAQHKSFDFGCTHRAVIASPALFAGRGNPEFVVNSLDCRVGPSGLLAMTTQAVCQDSSSCRSNFDLTPIEGCIPSHVQEKFNHTRAFTLIEMAVVMVILSLFAAATIPNIVEDFNQARAELTVQKVKAIKQAARFWAEDNKGVWPLQGSNCVNAVNALISAGYLNWDAPNRLSPWGTPFETNCSAVNGYASIGIEVTTEPKWTGFIKNALNATEVISKSQPNDATRTHVLLPGAVVEELKKDLLHRVNVAGKPELNHMNTTLNMMSEYGIPQNINNAKNITALHAIHLKNNANAKEVIANEVIGTQMVDTDDPRYFLDPNAVSSLKAFQSPTSDHFALNVLGNPDPLNFAPQSPDGSLNVNDLYIRAGFKNKGPFWLSERALVCNWTGWSPCGGDMFFRFPIAFLALYKIIPMFNPLKAEVQGRRWTVLFECVNGRVVNSAQTTCPVS